MSVMKYLLENQDQNSEIIYNLRYEPNAPLVRKEVISISLKKYAKQHCLYLLADVRKIEKELNISLYNFLSEALKYTYENQIKKPRAKIVKNKVELYSEKYNYNTKLMEFKLY